MTGRMRTRLFGMALCLTLLYGTCALAAQEPVFRLDMDSLNLQKGVSGNMIISMSNVQGTVTIASIEGLENFDVLSQSQSTSLSIVGNETAYKEEVHYTVMPKTAGQFAIKANLEYKGQLYETNVLNVSITEGGNNDSEETRDLFIKTILSHDEAYLGEKIVVTYELYSKYGIDNYGFTDYVAIDGVITKDMPDDQLNAEYVYLGGNRYAKYEVRQLIIDPIKTGTYIIPAFSFQANVVSSNGVGGGFGGFFNSTTPMYLQTEEKELVIKPLPAEGKPEDFSGIVGNFNLDSNYSRQQMSYGDSFTLQATASGECNLDGLKGIISGEISGVSVYETVKNITESVVDNEYHVQKVFEAILVPDRTGILDIAPISISFFNPASGKYERAEIPGSRIEVIGDMPEAVSNGGAIESVVIDQVNYSGTDDGYLTLRLKKEWIFTALILLGAAIACAAAVIIFLAHRKKQNPALKSIYKQLMGSKDINEIYNLFNSMIKLCFNLSLKASSKSVIQSSLPDANLAERVSDVIDYMESPNAREEKGYDGIKSKIKGIYRILLPRF